MRTIPKSRYFLAELVANFLFFVLCAGVCLHLFVEGYAQNRISQMLSMATLHGQSVAETFKATAGDMAQLAQSLDAHQNGDVMALYYDDDWHTTTMQDAAYTLTLTRTQEGAMVVGEIELTQGIQGEMVFQVDVYHYLGIEGGA